jgi:hypothetical protein
MGLIGKTSHTKFIPLEYMFSSVEDRLSILQGLFDTDGTPTVSAVVEYCTVSRRLLDGVKELAQSLGGTCISGESSVALPDGRLTTYYRARVKLPRRFKAFRLQRKQEKMDAVKRQREPYRAVDSVVRAKVGETVCISVESEDRLYLTSGYIPTHNTVMASKILLNLGVPTCILVHKEFLEKQWMEALRETLGSKATVGVFRRNKKDNGSTHDVVVASTQTITSKKRVIPEEFLNSFGLLVLDEVHRYGAEVWQTAIWKYPAAMRLGLTATPDRMDGMWPVIYSNIGPVAYELESEAIDNSVYIVKLRTPVNTAEWGAEWMDKMQRRAKMLSVLASHEGRNKAISGQIEKAYKKGRRILVISERINQLEVLRDMLVYAGGNPEHTGLLIGGTKKADREAIQEKQVIFSTYGMSKEGLDIPSLDTLFLASPQADIRQTVGRILRDLVGKCHPITVDFVDTSIEELVGQAFHRLRDYQAMGCHVHGDVQ